MIVMSDHSQTDGRGPGEPGERVLRRARAHARRPARRREAELALCPAARSAMVYVLDEARRDELVRGRGRRRSRARGRGSGRHPRERRGGRAQRRAASCASRPAAISPTGAGGAGAWRANAAALELDVGDGVVTSDDYPDALAGSGRRSSARTAATCSFPPTPGYEFVDWGGADHVGGGSHGSLHRDDSEGVLLLCGVDAARARAMVDHRRDRACARSLRCTVAMSDRGARPSPSPHGPHAVHVRVRAGLRKAAQLARS